MADGKNSDLPVRVASAVVMVLVAGSALWFGGALWAAFASAVALGVYWEWWGLVRRFVPGILGRAGWMLIGFVYIGLAALTLALMRLVPFSEPHLLLITLVLAVIGTDVGAYFTGRTFGGPKIAPKISPSKTWSGLAGGMLGAGLAIVMATYRFEGLSDFGWKLLLGAVVASIAQTGDFFESWMKRKAGVKDSGSLIPGHGGLFDRADGLLAVFFALGLYSTITFFGDL